MENSSQRLESCLLVTYCGIVISSVGLYMLPFWSPLFGIGIALTWLGVLQNVFESMFATGQSRFWRYFIVGALAVAFVLYPVLGAVVDYGQTLTQRMFIVIGTIAIQAFLVLVHRASQLRRAGID